MDNANEIQNKIANFLCETCLQGICFLQFSFSLLVFVNNNGSFKSTNWFYCIIIPSDFPECKVSLLRLPQGKYRSLQRDNSVK